VAETLRTEICKQNFDINIHVQYKTSIRKITTNRSCQLMWACEVPTVLSGNL